MVYLLYGLPLALRSTSLLTCMDFVAHRLLKYIQQLVYCNTLAPDSKPFKKKLGSKN